MNNLFLDTSSLLKLYHREKGTDEMVNLVKTSSEVYLSYIAHVEFHSSVWKNIRMGLLSEKDGENLIGYFEDDKDLYRWTPINEPIINRALYFLNKYGKEGLRTLDAIQLSTAVKLKGKTGLCYTHDTLLRTCFKYEGLTLAF